jgi:hypothetical protein
LFSAPATGTTGSGAGGAFGASGLQDAPEGPGPQESPIVVVGSDGIPASDTTTVAEAATSSAMSEVAAGDHAVLTGPAVGAPSSPPQMVAATASVGTNDNAIEEPEVIMGHPSLRALA